MIINVWLQTYGPDDQTGYFGTIFNLLPLCRSNKLKFLKNKLSRNVLILLQLKKLEWYDVWLQRYDLGQTAGCCGQFQSFTPARSFKFKNSKIKKHLKILWFYTSVSKITIIWCTVGVMASNGKNDRQAGRKTWHMEVGAHV